MEIDFIVKYLTHLEFSRHTTISDVHELARDVLKAWSGAQKQRLKRNLKTILFDKKMYLVCVGSTIFIWNLPAYR